MESKKGIGFTLQDYEDAFDEKMMPRGGRFDIDTLEIEDQVLFHRFKSNAQNFIDQVKTRPEGVIEGMPHVHFDFINNPNFNATAFIHKGKEFIGFNYGLILMVYEIFNRILSSPKIFPDLGNVELEHEHEKLPVLTPNFEVVRDQYEEKKYSPYVYPVDETRSYYANDLADLALNFLLLHEIAHLRYGHLSYVNHKMGMDFIMEFDGEIERKINPLTNKLLEWNADNWANETEAGIVYECFQRNMFQSDILNKSTGSLDQAIHAWLFTVSVLHRLSAGVRRLGNLGPPEHYPSPLERHLTSIIMSEVGIRMSKPNYGDEVSLNDLFTLNNLAVNSSEKGLELIFEHDQFLDDLIEAIMDANKQESDFFELFKKDFREKIRPELVSFARANDLDKSEGR
ncbi:hypothetical protein [Larkinella sp.]|uniref:hypothetical protein n=1 Tax=Larkinella sp. TaxID=2034517 RepID=UPI003BA85161